MDINDEIAVTGEVRSYYEKIYYTLGGGNC